MREFLGIPKNRKKLVFNQVDTFSIFRARTTHVINIKEDDEFIKKEWSVIKETSVNKVVVEPNKLEYKNTGKSVVKK